MNFRPRYVVVVRRHQKVWTSKSTVGLWQVQGCGERQERIWELGADTGVLAIVAPARHPIRLKVVVTKDLDQR
jgi:hypothetical protein